MGKFINPFVDFSLKRKAELNRLIEIVRTAALTETERERYEATGLSTQEIEAL